jgi:hypothetical protein
MVKPLDKIELLKQELYRWEKTYEDAEDRMEEAERMSQEIEE